MYSTLSPSVHPCSFPEGRLVASFRLFWYDIKQAYLLIKRQQAPSFSFLACLIFLFLFIGVGLQGIGRYYGGASCTSIGMSIASVLSSPKVYSIERPSLESDKEKNEEVGEPYRYSVMNTMWIRSKAPHSKSQGGGTIPSAPRPSTLINSESP